MTAQREYSTLINYPTNFNRSSREFGRTPCNIQQNISITNLIQGGCCRRCHCIRCANGNRGNQDTHYNPRIADSANIHLSAAAVGVAYPFARHDWSETLSNYYVLNRSRRTAIYPVTWWFSLFTLHRNRLLVIRNGPISEETMSPQGFQGIFTAIHTIRYVIRADNNNTYRRISRTCSPFRTHEQTLCALSL